MKKKSPRYQSLQESEELLKKLQAKVIKKSIKVGNVFNELIDYIKDEYPKGYSEGRFGRSSWHLRYKSKYTGRKRVFCCVGASGTRNRGLGIKITFVYPKELNEKYKKEFMKYTKNGTFHKNETKLYIIWLSEDELDKIPQCRKAIASVINNHYIR